MHFNNTSFRRKMSYDGTDLGSGWPSALQLRVRGSFLGTIWDIGCSDMCGGLTPEPGERA